MAKKVDLEKFIGEVLETDPRDLKEEFRRLPGDLARYNALYADAHRAHLNAKAKRERVYSDLWLDQDLLEGLEKKLGDEDKRKKPTQAQIEAAIIVHDDYQNAKDDEISAEAESKRMFGFVDAIRKKADMLQMLGAFMRDEMNAEDEFGE